MAPQSEEQLFAAIRDGDDGAFEWAYERYQQQVRLIAWRVSHRSDWVEDLFNEAWCRAFSQRRNYDPSVPFPLWMAGIVRNIYRELCRRSQKTSAGGTEGHAPADRTGQEVPDPGQLAEEAEVLAELNDCINRLKPDDAEIVRLRFFQNMTLRAVAEEVGVPESTLRDMRLPAAFEALRRCLERKKIRFEGVFPAHGAISRQ